MCITPSAFALVAASALLTACGSPPVYRGSGGMTAYDIRPEVYAYHYEHGFTGVDAMGWDPRLQHAWSRLGAARTCGVAHDGDAMLGQLVTRFGHDRLTHDLNGVGFHHQQSRKVPGFCTEARLAELKTAVPAMAAGRF